MSHRPLQPKTVTSHGGQGSRSVQPIMVDDCASKRSSRTRSNSETTLVDVDAGPAGGRLDGLEMESINLIDCDHTDQTKAAAGAGQINAVKKLIRPGVELEATDRRPLHHTQTADTALSTAVAHNDSELVEKMLEDMVFLVLQLRSGRVFQKQEPVWGKVLEFAVMTERVNLASRALQRGADANMRIAQHGSLLNIAACFGDEAMVRQLLQHGADINKVGSVSDSAGNCALIAATQGGAKSTVRLLLTRGAVTSSAKGVDGNLLQTAAHEGRADVVRAILEERPDLDVNDIMHSNSTLTPLWMARGNHWRILYEGIKPLHGVDYVEVMRLLLAQGARWELPPVALRQRKFQPPAPEGIPLAFWTFAT